jgi:hypothetical protein
MKTCIKPLLVSTALLAVGLNADSALLGEWTFNTGNTTAERLASSSNAAGVTVSSLSFNESHDDFGPGVVPSGVNDGIGFGGNSGQQVMFLHRAVYFDGGAPSGKWTSHGNGTTAGTGSNLSADGNAPFVFTVTAGASETVTVESLSIEWISSAAIIFQFQEAGASVGPSVTLNGGNPSDTAALNAPIVIGPGATKTFSFNVNSGALNTSHFINELRLNGTVVPEPGSLALLGLGGLCVLRRRRG